KTRKTKPPALLVSVPSSLNPPFNMEIESVTSASIKGEFFNRIRPYRYNDNNNPNTKSVGPRLFDF
ncbi:hypothetical protein WG622_07435, partial [Cognatishimia sp. D5M38]